MELSKAHREYLLINLIEAKDSLELARSLDNRNNTEYFREWQDIKLFLLIERVKFIETCLIDNEIDF